MENRAGYNHGYKPPELPAGLERAVLGVLRFHVGRENAISRGVLVTQLANIGFKVHERAMRAAINELRKTGEPICSTGGEDGGYWIAVNWMELMEYIERELNSRAMDLLEQEQSLRRAAEQRWGRYSPGVQYCLDI